VIDTLIRATVSPRGVRSQKTLDLRHLHLVIVRGVMVRSAGFSGVFGGYELRDIVC
jgi:hypothetical protein